MILSERVTRIEPSATLSLVSKINKMKEAGEKVISLGAGEPDFDTPLYIKDEAIKAIENGFTRYTPSGGIRELKKAIIDKFKKDNNLVYGIENIIVSNGAKHSLYNLFQTILNENDEVILASPFWVSYNEMIRLSGGTPVFIETKFEDGFMLRASEIEKAITKKTKAIIINSPNNPTGKVIDRDELEKIAELAIKHDFFIVSDEIYEKMIYDKEHFSIASISEEVKQRTIIINGVSKSHAMTGWRIGYMAGPAEIIKHADSFQGHTTSNPNSIAQKAATIALNHYDKILDDMKEEFKKRRDYMYEGLSEIKGFRLPPKPEGAFYLFVNIEGFGKRSDEFCEYVLENAKIGIVPGSAFGMDNFIRLSYTTSMTEIIEAVERLKKLFSNKIE